MKGNNNEIVERIISRREQFYKTNLEEKDIANMKNILSGVNFSWMTSYKQIGYEALKKDGMQCMNGFEFHRELTTKNRIIVNLINFYNGNLERVFEITPVTFIIDINSQNFEYKIQEFLSFYQNNKPSTQIFMQNSICIKNRIAREKKIGSSNQYKNVKLKNSMVQDDKFLWILKATGFNRGNGIHVFKNIEQLELILNKYYDQYQNKNMGLKTSSFVIQKYIEQPLLIDGFKFDIRIFVLLDQNMNVYMFKEGYLRKSSEKFDLDNIGNEYIHLTNNAIQKNCAVYDSDSHIVGWDVLIGLLGEQKLQTIIKSIKNIINKTMESVKKQINQLNR